MRKFDDFSARVERTKAEADANWRGLGTPARNGFFDGLLGGLLGELMVRVWWFLLIAAGSVGVLAYGFGISFSAALTLALAIGVGFIIVAVTMSDG